MEAHHLRRLRTYIKVESGHDNVTVSTTDTQYGPCGGSPLGVVSRVSRPYEPGGTEVWTTYTYDGSCRQLTAANPDGSTTGYAYSGNVVTTTDLAGKWKQHTTDALGNLTSVVEPGPNSCGTLATNYTYNAFNPLAHSGHGKLHPRRVRRCASGYAIPGPADFLEGHAAAVFGPSCILSMLTSDLSRSTIMWTATF